MTLIIASKASDGIVIGADQKVSSNEPEYGTKIFYECQALWSAAGLVGIRDDLLSLIRERESQVQGFDSLYQVRLIAENIVFDLKERYEDRLEQTTIEAILGGLEKLDSGNAMLYHIISEGYGEPIGKFTAIGSGRDYAMSIAKFLLDPKKDVIYNGKIIAFCIAWVAENLDSGVGGEPEVKYLLHNDPKVKDLAKNEIQTMTKLAESWQKDLPIKFGFGTDPSVKSKQTKQKEKSES